MDSKTASLGLQGCMLQQRLFLLCSLHQSTLVLLQTGSGLVHDGLVAADQSTHWCHPCTR